MSQQTMQNELDSGTRIGMVFVVEASAASALAVTGLLLYIAYSAIAIQRNASQRWSPETHIHYYFLNLLICDLILSIVDNRSCEFACKHPYLSHSVNAQRVYPHAFCTVQGLVKHVGDVGVALSTMAVALHMLAVLVFHWKSPPKFALIGLAIIWLVIIVLVVVPNAVQHNIYGPTGYWCWIEEDTMEQIGLDYIWMWLAATLNAIAYLFLILVMKRVILLNSNGFRWQGKPERIPIRSSMGALNSTEHTQEERVRASQMFFYPLVYIIVVLPISAARFSAFRGHTVPFAVTAVADTVFGSSGLFNVVLYALTRPRLMPRTRSQDYIDSQANAFSAVEFGQSRFHDTSALPSSPRSTRF
ncbi:hypothetical protein V8B97DRAFT_615943 [Scleroderma yunnanense]